MTDHESDHSTDHDHESDQDQDQDAAAGRRPVSVTDGSNVRDADIRVLLNHALADQPDTCPICQGVLGAIGHPRYDLRCPQCRTKYMTSEARDHPTVAMRTTPVRRLKRQKEQNDRAREGLSAISGRRLGDAREQQHTAMHSDAHGRPMSDGGRHDAAPCDRCGREHTTATVTSFPEPTGDDDVWWCVKCWAERVADTTPLSTQEATVVGIREYLDRDVAFAGRVLGRTDAAIRELSRRAFDKLDDPDAADDMPPMTPLTVVDLDGIVPERGD